MSRVGPAALAAAFALLLGAVGGTAQSTAERGEELYLRWCAECHGNEGRGDGPAADRMLPRPRDFTAARYQIRTTGSGELPTDDDLLRVMREGLPGTTMPGWPNLSPGDRRAVVDYIKSLSPFFEGPAPETVSFSRDPGGGEEALASGRRAYETLECFKCHGEAGRGDGSSAPTLEDWRGLPIRTADLTEPWNFNGGSAASEIHARILTGLDGTPMPSAIEALQAAIVSEDEVWHLAHYVRSLAPATSPPLGQVVRVRRVEGELPSGPDDEAWEATEPIWFPLAGQVIEPPRLFAPTVDGVWVEGLHDGTDLVLRLSWNDPSRSPDPAWAEWQARIAESLYADGTEIATDPLPDAVAVQFPFEIPDGRERPYFLMGDDRDPVYLWRWDSRAGVSEARAAGLGNVEPAPGSGLVGTAGFERGRWRLALRRPLVPEGAEGEALAFREGAPIPVAFYAWDGSSGETGARGAISTWYYLLLEEPRSPIVFLVPLLAVLLTGGLGLLAARRARTRWPGGS